MKRKSLDEIYQMYVMDIYRYLRSLCGDHYAAEDLMQETFIALIYIWRIVKKRRLSHGCSVSLITPS